MSKRVIALIFILSFLAPFARAQLWVGFHTTSPTDPEITLLESDNSHVKYQVIVPGMWVENVTQGNTTYQKLEIGGSTRDEGLGLPSLPRISVHLGVPAGCSLGISVNTGRSFVLSDYWVSPIPEEIVSYNEGIDRITEKYTEDPSVYALTTYYPSPAYGTDLRGTFISQDIAGVNLFPIRFNPDLHTLLVTDTLTVSVDFSGGSGPAIVELGLFNGATKGALLNHTQPLTPYHPEGSGSVQWVNAAQTAINCDYLIIMPDSLWTSLPRNNGFTEQVQRFANLRATLSGFDVCIVRAATQLGITPPGSIQRGPAGGIPNLGTRAFEGIKNYISDVFLNGYASHTGTGHLGFVLLIGDGRDEEGFANPETMGEDDWLIPTPRIGSLSAETDWDSDHFYANLCSTSPILDPIEDVAIGRFPVGNPQELTNMVDKIVAYSVSTGDRSWKQNILNISGRDVQNVDTVADTCDVNDLRIYQQRFHFNAAQQLHENGYVVHYAYAYEGDSISVREPYNDDAHQMTHDCVSFPWCTDPIDINYINSKLRDGVWMLAYYGHGCINDRFAFCAYIPENLFCGEAPVVQNPDRLHFVIDASCANSMISSTSTDSAGCMKYDGCSEIALVKSINGAIGFIGSSRASSISACGTMYDRITECVVHDQIGTAGIAYLRYKNGVVTGGVAERMQYHYMGDPALDLYSNPIEHDITSDTLWTNTVVLSVTTTVAAGATLTVWPGTDIILLNGAQLIVEGKLIAEGTASHPIRIHGIVNSHSGKITFHNSNPPNSVNSISRCMFYDLEAGVENINSTVQLNQTSFLRTSTALVNTLGSTILSGVQNLDNVLINSGTLTVYPGTWLQFNEKATLRSFGALNAMGSVNDSIVFCGFSNVTWKGLCDSLGSLNLDYCKFYHAEPNAVATFAPAGSNTPVTINHCLFDGSRVEPSGAVLLLWNSPALTQQVSNCIVQNTPAGGGMYLYNCKVDFDSVTIDGCGYVNSYIKKVTGSFTSCTFSGRASLYSVLFSTASCVPRFMCCSFENVAPLTGGYDASIYCLSGTMPYFGGAGYDYGVSNVIDDSSRYLFSMYGPWGTLPVIANSRPLSSAGRNDWYQRSVSGKYLCWRTPSGSNYLATDQFWDPPADTSLFSPNNRFDFASLLMWPWGLCGGAEPGLIGTKSGKTSAHRPGTALDDDPGNDLFNQAMALEYSEQYTQAQSLFRTVAASTQDLGLRWQAMTHIVTTDCSGGQLSAWIPTLIDSLIGAEGHVYNSTVFGQRLLANYYLNREDYARAVTICGNLLASPLLPEDSVCVATELIGIQMAGGFVARGGGFDDAVAARIPRELQVTSLAQGIQLEQDILAQLGNGDQNRTQRALLPTKYTLDQNYPNPFNPTTEIRFDLPECTPVELTIYNTIGQKVITLVDEVRQAGSYRVIWDSKNLSGIHVASGVYIYRIKTGNFVQSRKMALIR